MTLSNFEPVTKIEFEVAYNSDLLDINAIAPSNNLPSDWKITTGEIDEEQGRVKVILEGTDPLTGSSLNLTNFDVSIPDNATYGQNQTIKLEDLKFNNENVEVNNEDSTQIVAKPGDLTGDGEISGLDAYQISRLTVGLGMNVETYPGIDPSFMADMNQDGVISAFDSYIAHNFG